MSAPPASHARVQRYRFDPEAHRSALLPLLRELLALIAAAPPGPISQKRLHPLLRRHPKAGRGFFSRSELISGYRAFSCELEQPVDDETFVSRIRMRPVRTQSGVTPITVLSRPFPCPGKCVFCPNDARMPKSYLSDEPGCQRAEQNGFDPYLQTRSRLSALRAIGHATDKVELIVLGGTWSFYPEAYQLWFITRCFEAMNDFGAGIDRGNQAVPFSVSQLPRVVERPGAAGYNRTVEQHLRVRFGRKMLAEREAGTWDALFRAHETNESAACRCVGLVLETRPDSIDLDEAIRLRQLGCTKVQLGFQSLDDRVLALNKRGHDVATTRAAVGLLRRMGFKLHAHWMPNLLGSDPTSDVQDFKRIFDDLALRPDELKVYPCSLVESAELMDHYRDGQWRPYGPDELLSVLTAVIADTPRYCRLSRVIRDICSGDIVVGNRQSNFREVAERTLDARGVVRRDIRSRELGQRVVDVGDLSLEATEYETDTGREVFLELVSPDDRIAGFCRLSLPGMGAPIPELAGAALIRELHIYGASLGLGAQRDGLAQHQGLGGRLLDAAKALATERGYARLSVISAVGTRPYYRRHGFADAALYQHCQLNQAPGSA